MIYFLDSDSRRAARWLCDGDVSMCLTQGCLLASTVTWGAILRGATSLEPPPYAVSKAEDMLSQWARFSLSHYRWLVRHIRACADEWTYRFPGRIHRSFGAARAIETQASAVERYLEPGEMTWPLVVRGYATSDWRTIRADPFKTNQEAYIQRVYRWWAGLRAQDAGFHEYRRIKLMSYTRRPPPLWLVREVGKDKLNLNTFRVSIGFTSSLLP